ncbi:MAG: pilin [Acidimicrobiales bacterium]
MVPRQLPVKGRRLALAGLVTVVLLMAAAPPAFAAGGAPTLSGVISNLTNWIVGILAGVATLFLTIGGLRYLTAGGDPGQVEKAKIALKSAAIGYALAILAPLLVSILASLVGG